MDGKVFLCGGTREGEQFSRHLWLFQPPHPQVCLLIGFPRVEKKIQVRRLSSMRQARNFPAVAILNGKIFAMGGRAPENTVERLNSVEVYDVESNQWKSGKPLVIPSGSLFPITVQCPCSEAAPVGCCRSGPWREDLRGGRLRRSQPAQVCGAVQPKDWQVEEGGLPGYL